MKTAQAAVLILLLILSQLCVYAQVRETPAERDKRMAWWREARFGMFIHWGLYAIPAGEWGGKTHYGEWIRNNAQIPLAVYDTLVRQFNPVKFNADRWVTMAKQAGMKYIVLTSKHHDGFALFDSKVSDFDVMSTPFHRDIVGELAEACRKQGIVFCVYHSIMDWHHPDYLPRRDWEKDRSASGADYERYVRYMKDQLKELLTNYGRLGVLWFDGEWESTWTEARGTDLYAFVRSYQPDIIINNRVGAARAGMSGMTSEGSFGGDFGTPEQEVPATGIPGLDWESCMTMNNNWGYNKADKNFKSTKELVRTLVDIASKGGNYLLNVGPRADGTFPDESVQRLREIGEWMSANGESIYGTTASPFSALSWGRCTQKSLDDGAKLFLHVFDWPQNGTLNVPGLMSEPRAAYLLSDPARAPLAVKRMEDAIGVVLPEKSPSDVDAVVVLEFAQKPDINHPPTIDAEHLIFIDTLSVFLKSDREGVDIRYTLDGSIPNAGSPVSDGKILLAKSATVSARCFRGTVPVSGETSVKFSKVVPESSTSLKNPSPGLSYKYFEGDWEKLPDFAGLVPVKEGELDDIVFTPRNNDEHFGFVYEGYVHIPIAGVYTFHLASDDGSRLWVNRKLVVDNDGLHGLVERKSDIPLAEGYHLVRVEYFEKSGSDALRVEVSGPNRERIPLGNTMFRAE